MQSVGLLKSSFLQSGRTCIYTGRVYLRGRLAGKSAWVWWAWSEGGRARLRESRLGSALRRAAHRWNGRSLRIETDDLRRRRRRKAE